MHEEFYKLTNSCVAISILMFDSETKNLKRVFFFVK